MNKSPAFQFYPAEFLADENVVLMSNQEIGCYIKLMCYCWREGSIPSDITKLARLCGEDGSAMALLWQAIGNCFEQADGDALRLIHPRLEKERLKQIEHRNERSESGKKGAKARWDKGSGGDGKAKAKPMAEPMANDGSSSSTSSSTSSRNTYSPEFEQAWSAYPRKGDTNKKESFKAWSARLKSGATPEQIIAGVRRYAAYCAANGTEQNYIKQPQTFFGPNEHYLLDWIPQKQKPATGKQSARDNYAAEAAAAREKTGKEGNGRDITGECTVIR